MKTNRLLISLFVLFLPIAAICQVSSGLKNYMQAQDLYNAKKFDLALISFNHCINNYSADIPVSECEQYIALCKQNIDQRQKARIEAQRARERAAEAERRAAEIDSLNRIKNRLVFVMTDAMNLSGIEHGFETPIRKALTNAKHVCIDDRDKALWAVFIIASAREGGYKEFEDRYGAYLDIIIQIKNEMTGAILFEDEIKQDGGGDNYSSAVRDAYRQLNMNGLIG